MTVEGSVLLTLAGRMERFEGVASREFLRTLSKPQLFFLGMLLLQYEYVLHKLYQRWDSNHKFEIKPKKLESRLEPLINKWKRLYDITIQLHAIPSRVDSYSSGTTWLKEVIWEDIQWAVQLIPYWEWEQKKTQTSGKKQAVQNVRKVISASLNDYVNPFDPVDTPHLAYTIDQAIRLAETSDDFKKQFWLPFKFAFNKWIRVQEREEYYEILIMNNKAYVRDRSGRGTTGQSLLKIPDWVDRLYDELHHPSIILLPQKHGR